MVLTFRRVLPSGTGQAAAGRGLPTLLLRFGTLSLVRTPEADSTPQHFLA